MPASNDTFYNLKRLHCWFAVSALALLAATVWMVAADHNRQWKHYQRTFWHQIEPSVTGAPLRQGRRPLVIEQIWLPDLTIDYHFAKVARFDRCTTCHLGIDKTSDLEIRRGLPQPYSPHPRLDLFVGPSSPHPMAEFGCTICHDGQGSATQFKFASHSPDDVAQRAKWRKAHGWFRNPDWGLPMRPKRFAESNCLLCHRDVSDLEPSPRFPDPPAPKLVAGYHLVRQNGCFGCHEIPGFEDAQPIGPALSDWGRKPEALLAFERVERFLEGSPSPQPSPEGRGSGESEADLAFYLDAIRTGRREGFLWQKLRAPRSFDFAKTAERGYNEQLLMGRFTLSAAQREAVMTFVLGLEAEPPKEKYLPRPDARTKAIVEGRKVLDKYACAGCHTLEMERWTVQWEPAEAPTPPPEAAEYPWVKPQIAPKQLADSQQTDARGRCRAELVGMPQWNADEEQYAFTLWEPAAIAGKVWPVGGADVLIAPGQVVKKRGPLGGEFARLLYPAAVDEAKDAGAVPGPQEAWGWVPPPLVHTGRAVQPAWLHDYLLEPSAIRPAAMLRMPKYNLAPAEAAKLADYFAAAAGAEFPFDSDSRGRGARLATARPEQPEMWEKALRLVADRTTFCAKCHSIGDYSPGGQLRTSLAPNLERVAGRIRPEHLRRWIASPKSILPYAVMPVNFPADRTVGQDLLPGTSPHQLDAVVDLLLNYDAAMKRRASVRKWME